MPTAKRAAAREAGAELGRLAVLGVGQHAAEPGAGGQHAVDLVQRDPPLRPVGDASGTPDAGARAGVGAPVLGQEQPQADADRHLGRARVSETSAWQLARLPSWPQYWRFTPTERRPCFTSAVSSTTSTASGPPTSRSAALTSSSANGGMAQGEVETKWCSC
jgi:hypothetical protein